MWRDGPEVGAVEAGTEADGVRHGQLQNHVALHALRGRCGQRQQRHARVPGRAGVRHSCHLEGAACTRRHAVKHQCIYLRLKTLRPL